MHTSRIVSSLALAALVAVAVAVGGCDRRKDTPAASSNAAAARPAVPAELLAEANSRIAARQKAVKAWSTLAIPAESSEPCAAAPPPPKLEVNGFQTGTGAAKKTMTILGAFEVAGELDPSLPASVARDLATVGAAGRDHAGTSELGWAEIDHTTDELPFRAGPIAESFQYELQKLRLARATLDAKQLLGKLSGSEVVLVARTRVRPDVHVEAHTFDGGSMAGIALLYSYDAGAVVCAGAFDVVNKAESFKASKGEARALPDEELELLAYGDAVAHLRAIGPAPATKPAESRHDAAVR